MKRFSQYYKLEISRDGMKGYITLIEEEKELLDDKNQVANIDEEKKAKGIIKEVKDIIKVGLIEDKLIVLIANKCYNEKTLIAKGIKPIDGKDGNIKFYFDLDKKLTPKVLDNGIVDYRELDIINNVKKGDILAELIPPKEGVNGCKVTGDIVNYKKGKPFYINCGKNVKLLEDGITIVSEKDGMVELKGNKMIVSEVLEVENLDNQTGNIYFNGTVIVKGNALNGFQIKADGDVEVKGVVEGAYIENNGDIVVRQGIQGYNRPTIQTSGSVTTKFVENAIINAEKDINVEAIMHSKVASKESINAIGKRGLIVGGICRAVKEIKAKTIGSLMATSTILEVGTDPHTIIRLEELSQSIVAHEENLYKTTRLIKLLENLKKVNRLDNEKAKMLVKLIKTRDVTFKELKDLKEEHEKLKSSIKNPSKGKVKVSEIVYPGVKITIGNSTLFVRDEMKRCTFYREDGNIKIGPYWE